MLPLRPADARNPTALLRLPPSPLFQLLKMENDQVGSTLSIVRVQVVRAAWTTWQSEAGRRARSGACARGAGGCYAAEGADFWRTRLGGRGSSVDAGSQPGAAGRAGCKQASSRRAPGGRGTGAPGRLLSARLRAVSRGPPTPPVHRSTSRSSVLPSPVPPFAVLGAPGHLRSRTGR